VARPVDRRAAGVDADDDAGTVRATLAIQNDGEPKLTLKDKDDNVRVTVLANDDGVPSIELDPRHAQARLPRRKRLPRGSR
jgi:hypothetical protein